MSKCRFCGQIWPGAIRCLGCGALMLEDGNKQKECNNLISQPKKLKEMLIKIKRPNNKKD